MIETKMQILKDSNVIDQETFEFILQIRDYLMDKQALDSEEHLDMFLTHLAMATMRIKKKEIVSGINSVIKNEIESSPKLQDSKELWNELKKFSNVNYDDKELWFIYMHMINLLENGDGGD